MKTMLKEICRSINYGVIGAFVTIFLSLVILIPLGLSGIYEIPIVSGKIWPLSQCIKDSIVLWPVLLIFLFSLAIAVTIFYKFTKCGYSKEDK